MLSSLAPALQRLRRVDLGWRWTCLAALAAIVVHAHSLSAGFVFDDGMEVVHNTHVHGLGSWREIWRSTSWAGAGSWVPMYRPLTSLTFALNYVVGGLEPWGYHAVNVLLHGMTTALLARLLLRWGWTASGAGLGALVFAVHPIHVEVVVNIAGRKDLLVTLFVLALLLLHRRAVEGGGWALVAAPVAHAAALLSKETALVAWLVLIVQDVLVPPRRGFGGRRWWGTLASQAAVLAAYMAARWAVVGGAWNAEIPPCDNPLVDVGAASRVATALAVVGRGLALQLMPYRLSPDYSYPVIEPIRSALDPWLIGTVLAAAMLGVALWRVRALRRRGALLAFFYGATLFPASNLLIAIGTVFGERLLYLPSVAACGALGWALDRALQRKPRAAAALVVIALTLLAARSIDYGLAWRSDEVLFRRAASAVPDSSRVQSWLGQLAAAGGDPGAAVEHHRRAYQLCPDSSSNALRLALALAVIERHEEAEPLFIELVANPPNNADVLRSLADNRRRRGRLDQAILLWRRLVALAPEDGAAWGSLGTAALLRGDAARARSCLERAVSLAPATPTAWYNLALACDQLGLADEARFARQRFLETAGPDFAAQTDEVRHALGLPP